MNEGHRVALFCLVWLLFFFSLIIAKVPNSILFILDLCLMGQKDMFAFPFSGFEHSNPVFECSCSYCEKDSWLFQGSCSRAIWPAPVFSAKSISAIQIPVLPPVRKWEAVPLWEHAVQWVKDVHRLHGTVLHHLWWALHSGSQPQALVTMTTLLACSLTHQGECLSLWTLP